MIKSVVCSLYGVLLLGRLLTLLCRLLSAPTRRYTIFPLPSSTEYSLLLRLAWLLECGALLPLSDRHQAQHIARRTPGMHSWTSRCRVPGLVESCCDSVIAAGCCQHWESSLKRVFIASRRQHRHLSLRSAKPDVDTAQSLTRLRLNLQPLGTRKPSRESGALSI